MRDLSVETRGATLSITSVALLALNMPTWSMIISVRFLYSMSLLCVHALVDFLDKGWLLAQLTLNHGVTSEYLV